MRSGENLPRGKVTELRSQLPAWRQTLDIELIR